MDELLPRVVFPLAELGMGFSTATRLPQKEIRIIIRAGAFSRIAMLVARRLARGGGLGSCRSQRFWKSTAVAAAPRVEEEVVAEAACAPRLRFDDTKVAFDGVSSLHLVRAALVFQTCGVDALVKNGEFLLAGARRVFGDRLVAALVKPTFFAHFVAGEDEAEVGGAVAALRARGVGAILDYAAEADIDEAPAAVADGNGGASKSEADASDGWQIPVSREYDYTTEAACDEVRRIFARAIEAVARVAPHDGFAAIKVTALGNPALLERWSAGLVENARLFGGERLDFDRGWAVFEAQWRELFVASDASLATARAIFDRLEAARAADPGARVHASDVMDVRDMRALSSLCLANGPFAAAALTETESELADAMLERLDSLAALAERRGVRLMIDAEHSYFQPAIDHIALQLMRKYNSTKEAPVVHNTYQCYLRDAPEKLEKHVDLARREGWHFAAKLVRGAYLHLERDRAAQLGLPDPVHATLDDTHACFDAAVRTVLGRADVQNGTSHANCLVASHNQASIERAIDAMRDLGLDKRSSKVYFGQLLGMADHLTFTLGQHGYRAYKYVPYGPVYEVLPYLLRRAHENSDLLSGNVAAERAMLLGELKRRAFGGAATTRASSAVP